jgi:hypothetical protein
MAVTVPGPNAADTPDSADAPSYETWISLAAREEMSRMAVMISAYR